MAITPQAGYELDPNNPNRVRKIGETTTPDFGAISSASLSQTPTANFQTPPPTSSYPIDKNFITPPLQMSKEESDVQKLINSIMTDRGELAGEADFTAEQKRIQGITEKTTAQNDLYAKIQGLVNQSLALQNEAQYTIPNAAQVSAEGRGITAGGLAPLTASQLRMNQIKQGAIASEALALKSQYEVGQGNLENAKYLVNEAVKAKFDPAKARVQTAIDNLDLIMKSPAYTLAEKNRAQRQLDIQNEKARLLEKQEADEKDRRQLALTAQKYGAPPDVIQKIQNAKNFDEAMLSAGTYLQDPKAKLELQKLRYETEKARLDYEKESSSITGQNLPITGNMIEDVANIIASSKIGATTKTTLSAIVGVQSALEDLAKTAKKEKNLFGKEVSNIPGIGLQRSFLDVEIPFTDTNLIPYRRAFLSEGDVKADTFINGINLKVQQWASGAALTKEQTKQVEQMTPKATDSDDVAVKKTKQLYDFMNQQIRSALVSEGIDFPIPESVDLFSEQETLADIFGI